MLWARFSVLLLDMEYSDDYLIPRMRHWAPYYGKQALALFRIHIIYSKFICVMYIMPNNTSLEFMAICRRCKQVAKVAATK